MGITTADAVVVGGGVLGCAIAWRLKQLAKGSVVVVEGGALASQATSQAAGLLTRARTDDAMRWLVSRTYQAIIELAETEHNQPLVSRVGTVHIAESPDARAGLETLAAATIAGGLRTERLSADAAGRLVPWLNSEAVDAAMFSPDDGFVDPYLLAEGYASASRALGVQIRTGTPVHRLLADAGRITGVAVADGEIHAPIVLLAAGAWANRLAMPLGVGLATAPVRSQYWITESDPAFPRRHPVVVLPDANAYTRPELGGLVIGLRERRSVSVDPRALPADTTGFAFDDDPHGWNALAEGSDRLQRFLPALEHVGIRHHIAGFSTYTPDGRPILGPVDGVDGLLVASGCCGAGIAISGGVGFVLAELACGRRPSIDLAPFRNDRFGAVDPYDPAFRQRCAAARSNKSAG